MQAQPVIFALRGAELDGRTRRRLAPNFTLMSRHLLFICSQNRLRSPTAEAVFAEMPGVEVDSAGLNHDAVTPLSPEQLEWADFIFVMENAHREKLSRHYKRHLNRQRVIVLNIPDDYECMDPALIKLLKIKVLPYLS
jgi:predicted protein tyrosine phosphatase